MARLVRTLAEAGPRRADPQPDLPAGRRRRSRRSPSAPPAPAATAPICSACSTPKIETIEPGFGIEAMRLVAGRCEPLGPQPVANALAGGEPAPDLAPLVDRLAARLGARRLFRHRRGRKRRPRAKRPPRRAARRDCALAGLAAPGPLALAARAGRQCHRLASRSAAPPLHLARPAAMRPPRRRTRANPWRMVEEGRRGRRGARLFPGRGRARRPLLALPPRRRRSTSAPATSAGICTGCSGEGTVSKVPPCGRSPWGGGRIRPWRIGEGY